MGAGAPIMVAVTITVTNSQICAPLAKQCEQSLWETLFRVTPGSGKYATTTVIVNIKTAVRADASRDNGGHPACPAIHYQAGGNKKI